MSTISEKLTALQTTKSNIRAAIVEKGAVVDDTTPFSAYPAAIRAIPAGESVDWGNMPLMPTFMYKFTLSAAKDYIQIYGTYPNDGSYSNISDYILWSDIYLLTQDNVDTYFWGEMYFPDLYTKIREGAARGILYNIKLNETAQSNNVDVLELPADTSQVTVLWYIVYNPRDGYYGWSLQYGWQLKYATTTSRIYTCGEPFYVEGYDGPYCDSNVTLQNMANVLVCKDSGAALTGFDDHRFRFTGGSNVFATWAPDWVGDNV